MPQICLTEEQFTRLSRPVNLPLERCGGFQRLIYRLQEGLKRVDHRWVLSFTCDEGRKVIEYSNPRYGAGTYQSILRAICPAIEMALKEAGADTPPTFQFDED